MSRLVLLRVATRPYASLDPFAATEWEGSERASRSAEASLESDRVRLEQALFAAAGPATDVATAREKDERHAVLALARAIHNGRDPADDLLGAAGTRLTPALVEELRAFARARSRALVEADRAIAVFESALARTTSTLYAALADPVVADGIDTVSGSLSAKASDLSTFSRHGGRHVASKLIAYLARFATKTSPNAVFCATALAHLEGPACIVTGDPAVHRCEVLLSVAEARKIASTLAAGPDVEGAVVPRANPTLREEDGAWTFWRLASIRHADDREHLSRLRDHPAMRLVLDEVETRPCPLPELRRRAALRAGVDEPAMAALIARMIDIGVLIAEIEIPYNERRPLRHVALRARAAGCETAWSDEVLRIEEAVEGVASLPTSQRRSAMRGIEESLSALPHVRPLEADHLFRVDAASAVDARLPAAVLQELSRGVSEYCRLFAAMYPAPRYRLGWVRRFLAKFPAGADVNVLDVYRVLTEQGETYRPAVFPEPEAEDTASVRAMEAARDALASRAITARPGEEIPLAAALSGMALDTAVPRWAVGVLFQIAAGEPDDVTRGRFRLVLNGLFQGAGLSLSRFAHLLGGPGAQDDNPVVRELRRAWSVIERPGALVAEITYNHLGRTANAGLRPALFPFEIELPGDAASPGAARIQLRDLVVRWDPAAERFVLRWPARGTEVIPVINSGVTPVGFVSFLVAIGEQDLQPVGHLPGFDHPEVTRWPRVVSGRVVVFRERWSFRPDEVPKAPPRARDLSSFARDVSRWRERHGLPRLVFLHSSVEPKPRYFDLESPLLLDLLRRDLLATSGEESARIEVTEMLPGPDEMWIRDGHGRGHASEFLVQMSS